jgi:hypothetical protein
MSWAPNAVQLAAMYMADGQPDCSDGGSQQLGSFPGGNVQNSSSSSAFGSYQDRSDNDRSRLLSRIGSLSSQPAPPLDTLSQQPAEFAAAKPRLLIRQSLSPLTAAIAVGLEGKLTRKDGQAVLDSFQNPQVRNFHTIAALAIDFNRNLLWCLQRPQWGSRGS